MKNFKIRTACGILILAIGMAQMVGCGAKEAKDIDGTVTVATVEGKEIPLGVANFALRYSQAQNQYYYQQIAAMYGTNAVAGMWSEKAEGATQTRGEETKEAVFEKIKKMYLVRERATEYAVVVSEEEKTQITEAAKAFIEGNDKNTLSKMGVTQADIETYLELETYYKKAFEPMIADQTFEISDDEAKQSRVTYTYLATKDLSKKDKEAAQKKMQGLLDEYKKQEDIASFDMKAFTEEKDDGFMTSTASFSPDDDGTALDPEVMKVAKELKDGQIHDGLVEGNAGYFIVRMDNELDREATDSKKETIKSEKKQAAFDKLVQEWLDGATVLVEESIWDEITLTDKELYSRKPEETPEVTEVPTETTGAEETDAAAETPVETEATETPVEETETPAETEAPAN